MMEMAKRFLGALTGKEIPAGRGLTIFPDDCFIASYPKSGNTWARFLVANLIWNAGDTNFLNIEERIPDIHKFGDARLREAPRPRFLKTHEPYNPRFPKALCVARDVRSVFVSYYHHKQRVGAIGAETPPIEFAKLFLVGRRRDDMYGPWPEHVTGWLDAQAARPDEVMVVRYEDLKADAMSALARVAPFLGLERDEKELRSAVELSSFDRMRQLEKEAGEEWDGAKKAVNKNIAFVRAGKTNEWRETLDAETLALIEERCGEAMRRLGYGAAE